NPKPPLTTSTLASGDTSASSAGSNLTTSWATAVVSKSPKPHAYPAAKRVTVIDTSPTCFVLTLDRNSAAKRSAQPAYKAKGPGASEQRGARIFAFAKDVWITPVCGRSLRTLGLRIPASRRFSDCRRHGVRTAWRARSPRRDLARRQGRLHGM